MTTILRVTNISEAIARLERLQLPHMRTFYRTRKRWQHLAFLNTLLSVFILAWVSASGATDTVFYAAAAWVLLSVLGALVSGMNRTSLRRPGEFTEFLELSSDPDVARVLAGWTATERLLTKESLAAARDVVRLKR